MTTAAQKDPGPRTDVPGAGGPLTTLNSDEQKLINNALGAFMEVASVDGTIDGEEDKGLGPTFNGNSCAMCHAQPAVGGSAPAVNPQIALATLHGATNKIPSFLSTNGPICEARFVADGGVHGLFTIAGRTDSNGCRLEQPDFDLHLTNHDVVFRIPTPIFGLGLVEATPGASLYANLRADGASKTAMGIHGHMNPLKQVIPTLPEYRISSIIRSPISLCIAWEPVCVTTSRRETPAGMSFALPRCGELASGCSSCTTAAPQTCCKPLWLMPAMDRKPIG